MIKFHYPFRKPDKTPFTDADELYQALEGEASGHYLMGAHKFWHGGIHITEQSAPQCVLDDALRCMADGEVVAYRLNDDYRDSTFGDAGQKLKYSNSFCLVRHEYASEPNPEEGANHGKRNTLTFYSLYMHLLPFSHYGSSGRVRPSYWEGKVRARVRKRFSLHQDPVKAADGQPAGPRRGSIELYVGSVVEFDSTEIFNLTVDNMSRRMARCTLLEGGLWGEGLCPPTFWTIVEDGFMEWDTVLPATFNEVISTSIPIKAGDPIGYLGYEENLSNEQGETESEFQLHLELFATDSDVKSFLQNTAGLKTGTQYLHLPGATVLKKKSPSTDSVTLSKKHVIDLSAVTIIEDGGEECYEVSVLEGDQPVSGLLKKSDADIITQHDWEKLGFQIIEESNALADGFVDPENMPQFFRDLCTKIDTDGDGIVEPDELKAAMMSPATRDQWTRLVAHHPTEWKEKADSPKWSRLDQLFTTVPKTVKHEKQRIDNLVFWDELSGKAQMASGLIYHFHPIAFVQNFLGAGYLSPSVQEPGFYVVPESMTREALEAALFDKRDPAMMSKFRALNPDLGEVKAGLMIVLGDPNNTTCTYQEAQLMQVAQQVKADLEPLTPEEANFMFRHAAEIASYTGQTSTWLGVSAAVMEKHIAQMRDTLLAMERLHQESYRQHGHLKSPQFFAERKRLLAQLDAHLLTSTRLRGKTTLGDHPKLKTALGISSRSLVHHWNKAGGPGQIPGYSTHVGATSRAAKYMKTGGYIGIAIGGVSGLVAIQDVCNGGSEAACEKVKFTEGGKFLGATAGGIAGGMGGSALATPICAALSFTGVGGIACVAVVATTVGVGSWAGTVYGTDGGGFVGEKLYEVQQ